MYYLPKVGMRMVKTAIAVGICLLIYVLRGGNGNPVLSGITAIICMQPYMEHSWETGMNRIWGTIIGACFGLFANFIIRDLPDAYWYFEYIIIALMVIPALYVAVLAKVPGASALAGVVLLSVTLTERSPDTYLSNIELIVNALDRSFETIMGIVVALGVNTMHLPRGREKNCLFVSSFEGAIYLNKIGLTPYCMFELNQLLKDGMAFTIATERTPASLMADLGDVQMNCPVIAMNGAVLYDMSQKRYLHCEHLSKEMTAKVEDLLNEMDIHYFLNVVWQDILLIYYKEFKNEEERKLYETARLSPHRNYVLGERPDEGKVVYILIVVKKHIADLVEQRLMEIDENQELQFSRDTTDLPEDYCHFKIYNKNATKAQMLRRLREHMPQEKVVVFGNSERDVCMMKEATLAFATKDAPKEVANAAHYQLKSSGGDKIMRTMFRLYEPLPWQKAPKELRDENRKGRKN